MTRFVLAVHCHQPVGNFPWVLEEAYTQAYLPFVEVLERHPKVRVCFHYSGFLLDWFRQTHPDFFKRLQALVKRGQAEFLGGGYYEPILSLLPEGDALGQLDQMKRALIRLKLTSAQRPQGAWLAERVWEPQLPSVFARAGICYTIVDDYHLNLAGVPEDRRFGYYLTEDRGSCVALFPSSKRLRYLVPFKPIEEVIEFLRQLRSEELRAVILADDGEKFGLWPGTHAWVYREGWLEGFFKALEANSDWLQMKTFAECLESLPALGKVYVPGGSYEEMMEWSGGFFRNFLAKYREADTLYKKMLWVSNKVAEATGSAGAASAKRAVDEARQHLYMGQANDAYWHGIFGGLYLRHLRRSVWENLLKAERLLDRLTKKQPSLEARWLDWDADGEEEILLRSEHLSFLIDADQGGQLAELSDKESGLNLLDTLTRRPEVYHEKIRQNDSVHALAMGATPAGSSIHTPASIHDRAGVLDPGFSDLLVYDSYERRGWIDHCLPIDSDVHSFSRGKVNFLGDFLNGPYEGRIEKSSCAAAATLRRRGSILLDGVLHPLELRKSIRIPRKQRKCLFTYRLSNPSGQTLRFLFGSESNFALKDAHVNRVGQTPGVQKFQITDPAARLQLNWSFSRAAQLWYFPIETISDSEKGMERTYQGVSLTFLWRLTLPPGRSWDVRWTLTIESPHAQDSTPKS